MTVSAADFVALRVVAECPDYLVSSDGRVISTKRRLWRVLSATGNPYLRVSLSIDGTIVTRRVHVLVAEAFLGPRPPGLGVRHLNGDSKNNAASNLRWGTQAENIGDCLAHGTHRESRKTHCPSGHAYEGENLKITPSGSRVCLTCKRRRESEKRKSARRARGLKKSWTRRT